MQLGFPSKLAPVLFAQALSRLLLVYSAYSVIFAELLIILAGAHSLNWSVMWAGFLVGFPGFVLWWLMFSPLSKFSVSLYVGFLSLTVVVVSWAVLATMPEVESTKFLPFTLLGFALITSCGVAARARDRVLWATIGLVAANLSLFIGALLAKGTYEFDWRLMLGYVIVVVAVSVTPGLLRVNKKIQAKLDTTALEVMNDAERLIAAKKTAAEVHDTLLANLAVISHTAPGVLQADLRAEIETVLVRVNAQENTDSTQAILTTEVRIDAIQQALTHASSQGLDITVNGDMSVLHSLTPEAVESVAAALGQCLSNVLRHSGQSSAEVVFTSTPEVITVTIIDGGVGFIPTDVPQDRLGLRLSVTDRMENLGGKVKIWSDLGKGTAIIIQIPKGGEI